MQLPALYLTRVSRYATVILVNENHSRWLFKERTVSPPLSRMLFINIAMAWPGVFGVTTPFNEGGEKGEIEQGMNIIAAAKVCKCGIHY